MKMKISVTTWPVEWKSGGMSFSDWPVWYAHRFRSRRWPWCPWCIEEVRINFQDYGSYLIIIVFFGMYSVNCFASGRKTVFCHVWLRSTDGVQHQFQAGRPCVGSGPDQTRLVECSHRPQARFRARQLSVREHTHSGSMVLQELHKG